MGRDPLDVTRVDERRAASASAFVLRPRPSTRALALPAVLVLALGLGACSTDANGSAGKPKSSASASASSSASASASASAESTADPSAAATAGPTPTAVPTDVPKMERPGVTSAPEVSAKAEPFTAPVAYPDGVRLAIRKITKGAETGQGPGNFAGREFALFDVELKNDSGAAIELNQVAVTVSYGSGNLSAAPVYANDANAVDFGGTVAPGATATARYAFAVPAAELGRVRMIVDFDGRHTSAVFEGEVTP